MEVILTLRLSELYTSIQCEGPNTGRPTQFVRFAGCNMRCPGWPCDTQHAIDPAIYGPRGTDPAEKVSPHELVVRCYDAGKAVPNLCLTGGEPFMQKSGDLQDFVEQAKAVGMNLEVFTNGSFEFPMWALVNLQFIMDWKLQGSGEAETNYATRINNAMKLKRTDSIKFVVCDTRDLEEAASEYLHLLSRGCSAQFWVGAAWDRIDNQSVIDFVLANNFPWHLNVQMHKYIWPPDQRGV